MLFALFLFSLQKQMTFFIITLCYIGFGTWFPFFSHSAWEYILDLHCLNALALWLGLELIQKEQTIDQEKDPRISKPYPNCKYSFITLKPISWGIPLRSKDDSVEYDFETVHNIDEYGSDFTPTVRAGMKCWNMTVQYWLATNVYKRLSWPKPIK